MPSDSPFALFDDATWPDRPAVLFTDPIEAVEAMRATDVGAAIEQLDRFRSKGLFVAGYFAYELGYCLESRLKLLLPNDHGPLLRFQVYEQPQHLTANECVRWLLERADGVALNAEVVRVEAFSSYALKFDAVRDFIARGDVYQVNLTTRQHLQNEGNAFATYLKSRENARVGAGALLGFPDETILSFSPETFFKVRNGEIKVRPMKGTIARSPRHEDDLQQVNILRTDPKQLAENLMIVDLMRNDLSRVCKAGSVEVTDMFTVETYPTFHTLTSGVRGHLISEPTFASLLPALFPCGSVTGTPKIRAMEIIRGVERSPRGVYCGAIGFASRERMDFNVAIRTLRLKSNEAVLGVGGGIVWDSDARTEYDECTLKAKFFTATNVAMRLLETMRWTPREGLFLLERHLDRLQHSAKYFGFKFDEMSLRARLDDAVRDCAEPSLVRLTLGVRGDCQIELRSFEPTKPDETWKFSVSEKAVRTDDVWLYHKTTRREVYEERLAAYKGVEAIDELVLVNERGEITEGTRSNIFVERDGVFFTPPVSSGLLDGCLRRELIENSLQQVVQMVLFTNDLRQGKVWFGNSVRGLVRGVFANTVAAESGHVTLPDD